MRYKSKDKVEGGGKSFFIATLSLFILLILLWYAVLPQESKICGTKSSLNECKCSINDEGISRKNIVLIDVTDKIFSGKYPDIKNIIYSYALTDESWSSFFKWIFNGKKTEVTSVYLLTDKIPAQMLPIGEFCKLPPTIAMSVSLSKVKIKVVKDNVINSIGDVMESIEVASKTPAKTSPIIESISVITSNASSWAPGGDLVIVSDMLQNTIACGFFENNPIPNYSAIGAICKTYIDKFKANVQPSKIHRGKTNTVVCLLPPIDSKTPKSGLMSFWHEMFQDALNYDFISTCDPTEISDRKSTIQ